MVGDAGKRMCKALVVAVPYRIEAVLTDNRIPFGINGHIARAPARSGLSGTWCRAPADKVNPLSLLRSMQKKEIGGRFYSARGSTRRPLPWPTFAPPLCEFGIRQGNRY